MDRRQLEHFLAVASHGSFTSAAAALRIAQPSLSYTIRTLERELGAPLFRRLGRGVKLTPEGQALVPSAQAVLRAFTSARSSVQHVAQLESGRIDIVALTSLAVDPLAGFVGEFRRTHPGIDVRIEDPDHAAAVAERVRAGECELGLADHAVPPLDLRSLELDAQQMVLVMPPDAEIDDSAALPLSAIAGLALITTPPGTTSRLLLEQCLADAGVSPHIAVETPHRAAIVPLVLSGAGVALLPRPMADGAVAQGARAVAVDPPVVRGVRLLWREPLSRPAEAFLQLVRERRGPRPPAGTAGP